MKSLGIVRKVDELGRYTIPMELRRELHIQDEATIEISFELVNNDKYIVISNIENRVGFFRQIDKLGRIVIPKEIRRTLAIEDGESSLEVFLDGNKIYLRKYSSGCIFCGETRTPRLNYYNQTVCKECVRKLGEYI